MFDYLIVGAGFAGATLAQRLASQGNKKVLLVEQRLHIGGNAYDYYNPAGLLIHKYGPHIFHTNAKRVFDYLSQFTEWRPYEHRIRASVDGQIVPIPINLDTINRLYGRSLNAFEVEGFFQKVAEPREEIRTSEDVVVSRVGQELYASFSGATRASNGTLTHPNSTHQLSRVCRSARTATTATLLTRIRRCGSMVIRECSSGCWTTRTSSSCSTLTIGRFRVSSHMGR
jgi:UDP-galactopyranose mutase